MEESPIGFCEPHRDGYTKPESADFEGAALRYRMGES